jgi:hypothetical protein
MKARNNKELRRYVYFHGVDLLAYSNFVALLLKSYTHWKQAYNKNHSFCGPFDRFLDHSV